ncbi:hypothetical protein FRX31_033790, partial [Thalictrum thalictroides]
MNLPEELLQASHAQWDSTLIVTIFMGDHLNPDLAMKAIRAAWRLRSTLDLIQQGINRFVCRFERDSDKQRVQDEQPWKVLGKVLLIHHFNGDMDPETVGFNTLPVWMCFEGLKLEHFHFSIIEMISAAAGKVLDVQPKRFLPRQADGFRARVELNINEPIAQGVPVNSVRWGRTWVTFIYKDLPNCFCTLCFKFGHAAEACPHEHLQPQIPKDIFLIDYPLTNQEVDQGIQQLNQNQNMSTPEHNQVHIHNNNGGNTEMMGILEPNQMEFNLNFGTMETGMQPGLQEDTQSNDPQLLSQRSLSYYLGPIWEPHHNIVHHQAQVKIPSSEPEMVQENLGISIETSPPLPPPPPPPSSNHPHGRSGLPRIDDTQPRTIRRRGRPLGSPNKLDKGKGKIELKKRSYKKRKVHEAFPTSPPIKAIIQNIPTLFQPIPYPSLPFTPPNPPSSTPLINQGTIHLAWEIITNPASFPYLSSMGLFNPPAPPLHQSQPTNHPSQSLSSTTKSPTLSPTSVIPGYGSEIANFENQINFILHDSNTLDADITDRFLNAIIEPSSDHNVQGTQEEFNTRDLSGGYESRSSVLNHQSSSEPHGAPDHMLHPISPGSNTQ